MPNFNFFKDGADYSLQLVNPHNRTSALIENDKRKTYLIVIDDTLRFIQQAITTPYEDGSDVLWAIAAIPLYPVYDTLLNIILAGVAVYNLLHGLFTLNQQEIAVGATQITTALFKELSSFILPIISLMNRAIATIGAQEGQQSLFGEIAGVYTALLKEGINSLCMLTHNHEPEDDAENTLLPSKQ